MIRLSAELRVVLVINIVIPLIFWRTREYLQNGLFNLLQSKKKVITFNYPLTGSVAITGRARQPKIINF